VASARGTCELARLSGSHATHLIPFFPSVLALAGSCFFSKPGFSPS
jgi:hypothetical protein